jgi:hypothetical protein
VVPGILVPSRSSTAGQKYKNIGYYTRIIFTHEKPLKNMFATLYRGIEAPFLG